MKKIIGLMMAMSLTQLSNDKLLNSKITYESQRLYYRGFEKKNKKHKRK